jgi:hypothetical protein
MLVPVYFCFGGLELQITRSHFTSILISFLLCPFLLDCMDPSIRVDTHSFSCQMSSFMKISFLVWKKIKLHSYAAQSDCTNTWKKEWIILLWPGLESECKVNSATTLEGAVTSERVSVSKILSPQFQSVCRRCWNDISNGSCHVIVNPCFLFVFVLPHHSTLASLCSNSIIITQPIPAHTLVLSRLPDLLQRKILF